MTPTVIFTVIPYFLDGVEVFLNDVKSFTNWKDAHRYANREIDGRRYEIVESVLL